MKRRDHHGPWRSLGVFPTQDTLAYATALLNEKDQSGSSNGSESSPANENGERHLQQVKQGQIYPLLCGSVGQLVPGAGSEPSLTIHTTTVCLTKVTVSLSPCPLCVERAQSLLWWLGSLKVTLMMLTLRGDPCEHRNRLKRSMPGTYWNWSRVAYAIGSLGEQWLYRTRGDAGGGCFPER